MNTMPPSHTRRSVRFNLLIQFLSLILMVISGMVMAENDDNTGTPKIINGVIANYNFTPYMISLQIESNGNFNHICGGSIIEDKFVLTAAHCVTGGSLDNLYIYQGSGNLGFGGSRFRVERIFRHENYQTPRPFENDIALLYVPNLYGVELVGLASEGYMSQLGLNTEVELVGWGYYNRNNMSPPDLLYGRFFYLPATDCQNYYFNDAFSWGGTNVDYRAITDKNVCAGVNNFYGQQPCHGDSGGPLLHFNGSRYVQIGLTSFGEPNNPSIGLLGCGINGEPGVFTRVASFIPWISKTTTDFYNQQNSNGAGNEPSTNTDAESGGALPLFFYILITLSLAIKHRKSTRSNSLWF